MLLLQVGDLVYGCVLVLLYGWAWMCAGHCFVRFACGCICGGSERVGAYVCAWVGKWVDVSVCGVCVWHVVSDVWYVAVPVGGGGGACMCVLCVALCLWVGMCALVCA